MNNKIIKFQKAGKLPTAATYSQWLKGTLSYLTGIKDSDLVESRYIPSKATNKNTKYYTRKGLDYDVMRNLLGGKESKAKEFDGTPLYYKNFNDLYTRLSNQNGKQLRTTDNSHLGEYTVGIGQDKDGRYISYYDKFDWAPNESLEIFSPYEIYNRIYEKDFNRIQKELNTEEYSGSNPSGKWFFKSGINNKGYLKKGGLIGSTNARKWKHEDGGRVKKHQAFVNGVSILDSNPDAYKYVKKKIKKAAGGDNSKNWFSGVGNWLNKNQNTISTIGSAITNGVGLIKQNSELSKAKAAKEKELDEKYNPNNLINDSEIWNEVNNQISQLEQQNPDVHYGEVDRQNLYNKVRNQYLSKAKQYAQFAKTQEQQQYNQYISDAQAGNTSSLMNLIGNGISAGIGMFENKPSNNTNTSTTPTYQPLYKYDMMAPYKKDFTFKI